MIGTTTERGTHEIKMLSKEEKIRQIADREAWEDWAREMPSGQVIPDNVPQTVPQKPWNIVAFARSAMP
jgi:hypothetical protein